MQGQEGACLPLTDSGVFIRRLVWDPTSLRFLDWPSRYPKVEVRACVRACVRVHACAHHLPTGCLPMPYLWIRGALELLFAYQSSGSSYRGISLHPQVVVRGVLRRKANKPIADESHVRVPPGCSFSIWS